jgi:hypothetical protein
MSFKIGKEANEKEWKAALEGIVANCLAKANGKKIREATKVVVEACILKTRSIGRYPDRSDKWKNRNRAKLQQL